MSHKHLTGHFVCRRNQVILQQTTFTYLKLQSVLLFNGINFLKPRLPSLHQTLLQCKNVCHKEHKQTVHHKDEKYRNIWCKSDTFLPPSVADTLISLPATLADFLPPNTGQNFRSTQRRRSSTRLHDQAYYSLHARSDAVCTFSLADDDYAIWVPQQRVSLMFHCSLSQLKKDRGGRKLARRIII